MTSIEYLLYKADELITFANEIDLHSMSDAEICHTALCRARAYLNLYTRRPDRTSEQDSVEEVLRDELTMLFVYVNDFIKQEGSDYAKKARGFQNNQNQH